MTKAKTRARDILKALPLSKKQRDLYGHGVEAMDEASLERATSKLEAALSRAPSTLAAAREMLAKRQRQSRKRAVILVADEAYRNILTSMLGQKLEIETPNAPEEAIQMITRTVPDIVICDFRMPQMSGLDILREMRRAASSPLMIFVRTTNPEEDGEVAAAGATGYRVSNPAGELTRAVTSAIEASARLSEKV